MIYAFMKRVFILRSRVYCSTLFKIYVYCSQKRRWLVPFCVLKKWVHSRIGQCVRPAVRPSVGTITFESLIQLSWNFVHRMISSISRSSSKMRRIRQEMVELSKKLSFLTRPPLRRGTGIFFQKKYFSQNYSQHI